MNYFNNNLRLEKVDEDFTYANIKYLHENNKTIVEESSKNKFLLNFLSSNNYYKINYFFLKQYDLIFKKMSILYNFNYNKLKINENSHYQSPGQIKRLKKNKLDSLNYTNLYLDKNFVFANNNKIFEKTNYNFFKHYNILYFNNIILFTIILMFSYKYFNKNNYKNIYPLLIYFLTPQINSFIIFINSDYYTILLTPIIYLCLINKKFLSLFLVIFFLHLINRSTLIISITILLYYIIIFINYKQIKWRYIFVTSIIFFILIHILFKYNIFNFHNLFFVNNHYTNIINNSPFDNLINGSVFDFSKNIIKSIIILIISSIYLDGQNSFITSYYDYVIYIIIIFTTYYYIFSYQNEHKLSTIYLFLGAFLFMYFLNGFDQSRHHPLIYFSFIYLLFNNNKKNYQIYFEKLQLIFITFLLYLNLKIFYIQYILL